MDLRSQQQINSFWSAVSDTPLIAKPDSEHLIKSTARLLEDWERSHYDRSEKFFSQKDGLLPTPPDWMRISYNRSRPGLLDRSADCSASFCENVICKEVEMSSSVVEVEAALLEAIAELVVSQIAF